MSFDISNSEFLPEIFGILRSRRHHAELIANERRVALRLEYPEFEAIDKELRQTGSAIYEVLISGGDIKGKMESLANRNIELQNSRRDFLESHQLPHNFLEPDYICKQCSDSGYVNGKYCTCVQELLKSFAAKKLNETSPLTLCTFEHFDLDLIPDLGTNRKHMTLVYEYLKKYADDFTSDSPSLFLYGATGLGKTHLSLAIANEVTKTGRNVIYGSAPMIFQKISNEVFDRNISFSTQNNLIDCNLLVLDDLGAELITQLSQSALYNIINSRILLKRPTIISSNIDIDKLDAHYHQRIVSRIAFSFESVPFVGRDMRQIKKML